MEATKKRQLKKRYKTLIWLGYLSVLFFALFLTTIITIRNHSTGDWSAPIIMIPILVGLLLPLFAGLMFTSYSSFTRSELQRYKFSIQTYRARMFAMRTIEHLQEGELQQAVNEYIKCNWYPDKRLDDYVYGMLIMACQLSKDEKLHKQGLHRINEVKERFDPAKVKL
jgi:uncharacterized membrane protein YoaT (DUF817 family)